MGEDLEQTSKSIVLISLTLSNFMVIISKIVDVVISICVEYQLQVFARLGVWLRRQSFFLFEFSGKI